MITDQLSGAPASSIRLRPIALPSEHGGWGLLLEPILLGLLSAPSIGGLWLALSALLLFLARHPLKMAFTDRYRRRLSRRTNIAVRFASLYVALAIAAFVLALKTADGGFLLPLLIAAPIAAMQAGFDYVGKSRAVIAELAGPIAIGAIAPAIALAAGLSLFVALGLWAIQVGRALPTILYLRARLRLIRRKTAATSSLVVATHVAAVIAITGLARVNVVPWLAALSMLVLLIRAWLGLSGEQQQITAKALGIRELAFGAMNVFATALGRVFNL